MTSAEGLYTMITAYIVGDSALVAKLNAMPNGLRNGIARAVTRLAIETQRLVQQKLSGSVLKVRTGVLRSSINYKVEQSSTGVTATVGTAVKYAPYHEFGISHSWEIRPKSARALAFELNGKTIFAKRVIHPPLPERSFLRSALKELTPKIENDIREAVAEAIRG
jgi:phage gpG-like protein